MSFNLAKINVFQTPALRFPPAMPHLLLSMLLGVSSMFSFATKVNFHCNWCMCLLSSLRWLEQQIEPAKCCCLRYCCTSGYKEHCRSGKKTHFARCWLRSMAQQQTIKTDKHVSATILVLFVDWIPWRAEAHSFESAGLHLSSDSLGRRLFPMTRQNMGNSI